MTNYYTDNFNVYRDEPITKRIKEKFKKYFVVDAGQLVIGLVGLGLMVWGM